MAPKIPQERVSPVLVNDQQDCVRRIWVWLERMLSNNVEGGECLKPSEKGRRTGVGINRGEMKTHRDRDRRCPGGNLSMSGVEFAGDLAVDRLHEP